MLFYRPDAFPISQATVSKHWRNRTLPGCSQENCCSVENR